MSVSISAYLADIQELEVLLGSANDQWAVDARSFAQSLCFIHSKEEAATQLERTVRLLVNGSYEEAVASPYFAVALEALCASRSEKLPAEPFGECHLSLLDECGRWGELLTSRGPPFKLLSHLVTPTLSLSLGYILLEEAPECLNDVTTWIDQNTESTDPEVLEAWWTLEQWMQACIDDRRSVLTFVG